MTRLTDTAEREREDVENALARLAAADKTLNELETRIKLALERIGASLDKLLLPALDRLNELRHTLSHARGVLFTIHEANEKEGWNS